MADNAEPFENTRDSILYLIDASASMASAGALKPALYQVCQSIRSIARDGNFHYDAGVIVYNISCSRFGGDGASKDDAPHSDNAAYQNNTKVLLSLEEPSIDNLKAFIRIASSDEGFIGSQLGPGTAEEVDDSLLNALRVAKHELNQLRTRSIRRVIIITNCSNPFNGDSHKQKIAANLVSDVTNSPAVVEPILVKTDPNGFDTSLFWSSLNYFPSFLQNEYSSAVRSTTLDPISIDTLSSTTQSLILSQSRRKHIAFRSKLQIKDMCIGVRGYNIILARPRIPQGRKVAVVKDKFGHEKRELLVSERTAASAASGAEIDLKSHPSQKAFKLSSSGQEEDWTVPVSKETLARLYDLEESETMVLDLEAFIPMDTGISAGFIRHSTLLVASNERYKNSASAFASLHRSMVRKKVAAVITMHFPRSQRVPPIRGIGYAADPAGVKLFEKQRDIEPSARSGIYFVPLPFEDDLRNSTETHVKLEDDVQPKIEEDTKDEELTALLLLLMHKFRLPTGFNPYRFPHPKTAQFSEVLEHHALNIPLEVKKTENAEVPAEQPDPTRPKYAKIVSNSGKLLLQISSIYNELSTREDNAPQSAGTRVKRTKAAPAKRKLDIAQLREPKVLKSVCDEDSLSSYTVDDLLNILKSYNAPAKRERKSEIIEKVKQLVRN